jgi:hypothetical protein
MSIGAMNWVNGMHKSRIKPNPRHVLKEMADFADENDECWPSVETLSNRTSLSERAVQSALRVLERMGAVFTFKRRQTSSRYRLNRALDLTKPLEGADAAPRKVRKTKICKTPRLKQESSEGIAAEKVKGAESAPTNPAAFKGAGNVISRVQISSSEGAAAAPEPPENHQRTTRGRGAQARVTAHPLAADWQPSGEDAAYAERLGLDPAVVADRFRKHHLACGRPVADVSARWQLWCDEDAERAGKGAPANLPALASCAAPAVAEPAAALAPACQAAGLMAEWRRVHETLRHQAGAAEYRAWLGRLVLLGVEEGYALIAAPGRFHRDHVAGRFGVQIEAACRALLPDCRGIVLQVAEPARQCA